MKTKVYFAKVKPDAKIPSKRDEDAGFDIYAYFDEDYIPIQPHETKLIPTGIASVCDEDYCFILKERGSTGTKGIAQRCGVIDSGYRGEWFVPITNTTRKPLLIYNKLPKEYDGVPWEDLDIDAMFTLYPTTKAICQALVIPVPQIEAEEISFDELQTISSERGNGALGSSGK